MKLYFTTTSPFVRKVLVAARELGVEGRIATEVLRPSPLQPSPELSRVNPLSKIPALVLDDGEALYDSRVICEYLETLAGGRRLVPASGADRFRVLRNQALADGVLEAGISVFYERAHRPPEQQSEAWMAGQAAKAQQGLDELERLVPTFGADVDLAQIATACTFGWLEFRSALGDVRGGRPKLTAWYDAFRARPSMRATEPSA